MYLLLYVCGLFVPFLVSVSRPNIGFNVFRVAYFSVIKASQSRDKLPYSKVARVGACLRYLRVYASSGKTSV